MSRMIFFGCLVSALLLGACNKADKVVPVSSEQVEQVQAPLINTEGQEIGKVKLVEEANGVTLTIQAQQLTPGVHGVHIHETGVCTPPDFTSAGAHFNPTNKQHGFNNPKGFHAGDLPNIEVGEDGTVSVKLTTANISLKKGAKNSIIDGDGSAFIIHEKEDDYVTDPAGNAGDRIACAELH